MSGRYTLSQQPFSDGDYSDGEIKKLVEGTPLWTALHCESWLNCSHDTRQKFLDMMAAPAYFVGTVISVSRGQVELTVISKNATGDGPGKITMLAISLDKVSRFV